MLGDVRVDVVLWVFSIILDKAVSIDFLHILTFNSVSFDNESSNHVHSQKIFHRLNMGMLFPHALIFDVF